jgi:lipopolysaccharide transport system ATP-binding protein
MSSERPAVRAHNLSKHYLLYDKPEHRLLQMIVPRARRMLGLDARDYFRDFAALRDVSFEVRHGETVGIVGRNGSGKSTLLQTICGNLRPTQGTIQTDGRIAALLELGAGFNPEFTGRENVFLNAAILGIPRARAEAMFEDIAAFADIGDFMDQPVKTYSSGMYVRLAFAAAIHVQPDILVVDEALAVGDEAFQRKCFARIEDIKAAGGTIVFVSHSAQSVVQLCDKALLFDAGELLLEGRPKAVVDQYHRLLNAPAGGLGAVREAVRRSAGAAAVQAERAAATPDGPAFGQQAPLTAAATPPDPAQDGSVRGEVPPMAAAGEVADVVAGAAVSPEAFDPGLVSPAQVEFESHGVDVGEVLLLNLHGDRVNVLETGRRYRVRYAVDFRRECRDVGFGIGIRTVSGFSFGGGNLEAVRDRRLPRVAAGRQVVAEFEFDCLLLAGNYFINIGVLGACGGDRRYLYRIADALQFRVAAEPGRVAGGLVDFGVQIRLVEEG